MTDGSFAVRLATVSGPSGAGKSSYVRAMLARKPDWRLVPSVTTRAARAMDLPGEYSYVDDARFDACRDFAWSFEGHGHRYGTRRADIFDGICERNTLSLLNISPETVPKLRQELKDAGMNSALQVYVIHLYCCAPSEAVLRARLERRRARGDSVTDEEIERRIADCKRWDAEAYASGIPYVFLPGDVTVEEGAARFINVIKHQGGRS